MRIFTPALSEPLQLLAARLDEGAKTPLRRGYPVSARFGSVVRDAEIRTQSSWTKMTCAATWYIIYWYIIELALTHDLH